MVLHAFLAQDLYGVSSLSFRGRLAGVRSHTSSTQLWDCHDSNQLSINCRQARRTRAPTPKPSQGSRPKNWRTPTKRLEPTRPNGSIKPKGAGTNPMTGFFQVHLNQPNAANSAISITIQVLVSQAHSLSYPGQVSASPTGKPILLDLSLWMTEACGREGEREEEEKRDVQRESVHFKSQADYELFGHIGTEK